MSRKSETNLPEDLFDNSSGCAMISYGYYSKPPGSYMYMKEDTCCRNSLPILIWFCGSNGGGILLETILIIIILPFDVLSR